MVDMDCSANARKTRMIMSSTPNIGVPSSKSPSPSPLRSPRRLTSPKAAPAAVPTPTPADVAAYEQYLHLPDLSALWVDEYPEWRDEAVLRPALQALEITFRFASVVLSDRRPYADRRLWARRVEGLAAAQVQIIADLVAGDEYDEQHAGVGEQEGGSTSASSSRSSSSASLSTSTHGGGGSITTRLRGAPVTEIRTGSTPSPSPTTSSYTNLATVRARTPEVWKLPGEAPVVSRTSEESLLPLLATWDPSKPLASRILDEIEAQFKGGRCPFTLGLGEPNLDAKPVLMYDAVCRPSALHALKLAKGTGGVHGAETSQAVFTAHQVLECWAQVARQLLRRIDESVTSAEDDHTNNDGRFSAAASDCWALERVWKLMADVEDLHLLLDPDDFLRLRARLAISGPGLCFRSKALSEAARESRDLRRHVPAVLGVEADPTGGPALQDAAMLLFRRRGRGSGTATSDATYRRVHLLQAFQAVDAAVKKFFFAYRQVVVAVMGSLEVEADQAGADPLAHMFMEPPYCPSIDAAKTFLGDHYCRKQRREMLQKRDPVSATAEAKSAQPALTHL